VPAVHDQPRRDLLAAARPAAVGQRSEGAVEIDAELRRELHQHFGRQPEIPALHRAEQRQRNLPPGEFELLHGLLPVETVGGRTGNGGGNPETIALRLFRFGRDDPVSLIRHDSGENGDAGFDDPRLFPGDFPDGVAEVGLMVEGDAGDDRSERSDDVGGVEPAAHPRLPDDDVHARAGEDHRGKDGGEFKIGEGETAPGVGARRIGQLRRDRRVILFRNREPVDPEALPDVNQVGRGVESGGEPRAAQHAFEHGAHGALAVGSGDVEEGELFLRVPDAPHQLGGGFEPRLDSEHRQRIEVAAVRPAAGHTQRLPARDHAGIDRL